MWMQAQHGEDGGMPQPGPANGGVSPKAHTDTRPKKRTRGKFSCHNSEQRHRKSGRSSSLGQRAELEFPSPPLHIRAGENRKKNDKRRGALFCPFSPRIVVMVVDGKLIEVVENI